VLVRGGAGNASTLLTPAGREAYAPGLERPSYRERGRTGAPATWTPPAQRADSLTVALLTGPHTASRRLRFSLVNACTIASIVLGMASVFLAARGDTRTAAAVLLICVGFDGLDGFLARKLGVATPFGAQMDSLADMCSFGIATPVVAYTWLSQQMPTWLIGPICAAVTVCAALRLARFNVSPKNGAYFCGVPTTIAAAVIALCALVVTRPFDIGIAALILALALLMVSSFPYVKLGRLIRLPLWLWAIPGAAALVDVSATFMVAVTVYLASGPVLWMRHRRTPLTGSAPAPSRRR
jgi:CDP-diacylglycerol--serine O-phosphatidyltransferase